MMYVPWVPYFLWASVLVTLVTLGSFVTLGSLVSLGGGGGGVFISICVHWVIYYSCQPLVLLMM